MSTIWVQISLNLSIITACLPSLKSVLDSLMANTGVTIQAPLERPRDSAAFYLGVTPEFDEELARLTARPASILSAPPRHKFQYSGRATLSSTDNISESYAMQDLQGLTLLENRVTT